ncbi:MAG TPA: hypothetical protein VN823_27445 [Stellaceae bacterium]|nr:hypothetical protein [Stellaceae bacterium]
MIAPGAAEADLAAPVERLERPVRVIAGPILAAFAALGVYAAVELRGLYADGSAFLLRMMESGGFFLANPPRRIAHILQQLPVVLAMRLGVTHAGLLGWLFGLAMHLVPLALVAACYWLSPRGKKAYFLFPLFHYLAGSQAAGFAGIAEAPMASAYFWFLLFLIVFRRVPPWALALAALPALSLHEAFLFLGPVLALASAWRARSERATGTRVIFRALAVWFVLIAAMQIGYIVTVPDSSSRDSFIGVMLGLGFLIDPSDGFGHGGVNIPALMGIMAAGAVGLAGRLERRASVLVASFALLCAMLVAGTAISEGFFAPALQFQARGYGAVLSLPLSALFLLSLRNPAWATLWTRPAVVSIVLVLALGQLGWQALGTWYWSRYIEDFRAVLSTHRGLVSWPEAVAGLPPDRARLLWRLSWYWTNPSLSIVLSPDGKVAALVDNPVPVRWQPFDPADPDELPAGPLIDTGLYRAALAEAKATTSP